MLAEFEIIGRIARISDLEGKNGTAALLSVASTESWQKDGAWKEKTYFHTLTVRKGLENVARDLNVGDREVAHRPREPVGMAVIRQPRNVHVLAARVQQLGELVELLRTIGQAVQ